MTAIQHTRPRPLMRIAPPHRQHGTVLVISLIMMLLLTLIGVTAMQTTTMEERMAGNMVDVNRSFQAAEAALRFGEGWLAPLTTEAATCSSSPCDVWARGAINDGTRGVDPGLKDSAWWAANAKEYGTEAQELDGLADDPLYVIEHNYLVRDSKTVGFGPPTGRTFYRVTARAVGGQDTTETILQTTYVKRYN